MDSYTSTMIARATARSPMDSIEFPTEKISPEGNKETSQDTRIHILDLANILQDILGVAMATATTMFPQRVAPPPQPGALCHVTFRLTRLDLMSQNSAGKQRQSADSCG